MAEFGKWTSVEEQEFPKEKGNYIVFGTYYFTPVHRYDVDYVDYMELAHYDTNYGWICCSVDKVKYWMKAPEKPKEGGDKE